MNQMAKISSLARARARLRRRPLHLAIGMFDGVHLGHRAVIESAVQSARRSGGLAGVLTFDPHPSALFRPEERTRLILGAGEKASVIASLGVDALIVQPFTIKFSTIEAEKLLGVLRRHLPGLEAVYVGENFRFGRGRRGDVDLLIAEGRRLRINVFSVPRVRLDGQTISSTRIRRWLANGSVERVNEALGYSYFCEGRVVRGRGLGRTIGFPTLNIAWSPDLEPKRGVYAVRITQIGKGRARGMAGIANFGVRPTVSSERRSTLEIHVLGRCPIGPGDRIRVDWLSFMRAERKFESLEALKKQIGRDIRIAAK
jgi:riboflavin kinase/FMN adenylyltransferase